METFTDGFAQNSLRHYYESMGIYYVAINAINEVEAENKSTTCTVYVQDPIANLEVRIPPPRIKNGSHDMYIATSESITVEASISNGTNVSCDYDFGENVLRGDINEFTQMYAYHTPGEYAVNVRCTNRVSNMYKTHFARVIVQKDEPIKNLQVQVDVASKGTQSVFTLLMTKGTAFICYWTLGDGTTLQTDVSEIDLAVLHEYDDEGAYEISVLCENQHGPEVAQSVAWVQIPIVNLTCDLLQRYVTPTEKASFNISVKSGSNVIVVTVFENNQSETIRLRQSVVHSISFIVEHLFRSNGLYVVKVNASNLLGELSTTCTPNVVVQNPLLNIALTANATITEVSEYVAFSLETSALSHSLPTDASCSWDFGDNSSIRSGWPLVFTHGKAVMLHHYLFPGKFLTYIYCSNEVSRIALNTTVTVLELIKPLMKVCLDCNYSTIITDIPYRKYFTLGDHVTFMTTSQDFDKAYHWKMTVFGVLAVTKEPITSVILGKKGKFSGSVLVDKVVQNMSASVEFIVQEKISGVTFSSSGFTWLRSATRFQIAAPKFDEGTCFKATLSDFSKPKFNCSTINTNNYTFSFNHTYHSEGNYSACLTVFNNVSEAEVCVAVEVTKPDCRIETVSIWESVNGDLKKIDDSLQTLKYKRSEPWFQFKGSQTIKCALATSKDINFKWIVKRLRPAGDEPNVSGEREERSSQITTKARSLSYGKYLFAFIVELDSNELRGLYGEVIRNATINVEVTRSPLIGGIKGGKQNVSKEETLTIDASFRDPDLEEDEDQEDMEFKWYCRTLDFAHCYDNQLSSDNFIKIIDSPIFTTSLDKYVGNKTYIFKVEVTKEDREPLTDEVEVFVAPPPPPPPPLPPPPPEMKIR